MDKQRWDSHLKCGSTIPRLRLQAEFKGERVRTFIDCPLRANEMRPPLPAILTFHHNGRHPPTVSQEKPFHPQAAWPGLCHSSKERNGCAGFPLLSWAPLSMGLLCVLLYPMLQCAKDKKEETACNANYMQRFGHRSGASFLLARCCLPSYIWIRDLATPPESWVL